jgi:two-component system, LytTR family, sensor histidine kinase AlgZ
LIGGHANNRVLSQKFHQVKDSQILSGFHASGSAGSGNSVLRSDGQPLPGILTRPSEVTLVFDACSVGVVLRTVLFVEVVLAIGVMFASTDLRTWLNNWALVTGAALPAALAWLLAACALKKPLQVLPRQGQYIAGVALGALAGLYGCGLLALIGLTADPPWLASAVLGAGLAAALVTALVLRARGQTPAATAARLSELQARIRPHFLFNTLNSAIALVREEPALAETVLEDLSELFRHALAEQGQSVPLSQELELARRYLAIEQVRFGERLRVEWVIDAAADEALLPPLLLQPLVENAVKHGVEPSESGAQIKISTQRRSGVVVIKVTNSVPAGSGARGNGLALANVRDRLSLLHDVQGSFLTALKDGVFQARIEIPAPGGAT